MAEPFKNQINETLIRKTGAALLAHYAAFDLPAFVRQATANLEKQELKERSLSITEALETHLPGDFPAAAAILEKALKPGAETGDPMARKEGESGLSGWAILAVQEYVGRRGLDDFEISMKLLKLMTMRLTSEFGIRYFLDRYPYETLKTMQVWVKDPNEHVRRLVSEGTRPRLPWGMQLKRFIADPSPIIPLLEVLKDDPSEYVRRSVANNLNDISKDHPEVVCLIAERWLREADVNRQRLIRHALRTLVKQGNPRALTALGYGELQLKTVEMKLEKAELSIGGKQTIEVDIQSGSKVEQSVLMDFAVHYQKAGNRRSRKVFKWKTFKLTAGEQVHMKKRHAFVDVSVRRHYPGPHEIELLLNGISVARSVFHLSSQEPNNEKQ